MTSTTELNRCIKQSAQCPSPVHWSMTGCVPTIRVEVYDSPCCRVKKISTSINWNFTVIAEKTRDRSTVIKPSCHLFRRLADF